MATAQRRGPLDAYIHSLRNGERFYADWVRNFMEHPQRPGDWNGPGTPPPVYPARWPEQKAKDIAARVIRLMGEESGLRAERRFALQRALNRDIAEVARRDASLRRLDYALRTGRTRRKRRRAAPVHRHAHGAR